ncbi:hypothetical protein NLJ89_g2020 [Agrocybe chaxingu]|uniref:Major facilitator superfamily (MFS) profile domain-containing protein n=1 Tax=Agrocybe chaxingu TaxID=84603 RepID=A0A9W8MYC3_9AGAR|nr:hypothetical protein NLJ89_g2020 [Agrocybe chaxingu]
MVSINIGLSPPVPSHISDDQSAQNGYIALSPSADQNTDRDYPPPAEADSPLLDPSTRGKTLNLHGGTFTVDPDGHSYSYAYGPKGLAGLRHNKYALLCTFFASIGGLEFGYDQGVIANVLVMKDFMHRWPITPLQKGVMTAVLELGALIGALAAGIYADKYSRRHSILVACIVFCVGSSFQAFAHHISHIFIGRAIGGVGVGALSMLSPLYMAEISPPEVRGSLMALEQLSIVLGVVFGFWTGFMTREYEGSASWRIPLGIQIIPGLILGAGCYFLPPSPRLLVLHGQYEDALRSLARLRRRTEEEAKGDALIQIELLEMRVETTLIERTLGIVSAAEDESTTQSGWEAWKKLFDERYRDRTWIGVMIMVFQQWSGINALLYYGPTLVHSIGLRGDTVTLLVSGGIGVVQLIAVLPAIVWIDKAGRKGLLRGGSAAMAASHLGIAVLVLLFQKDWAAHRNAAWIAVGGIYTFTFAYGVSIGPIGWVLPIFIGLLTPVIVNFSPAVAFLIFAAACVAAYFWATYYVPETANVSLEEVDKLFKSSAGVEEAEMKREIEQELGLTGLIRELADDLER